MYKISCRKKQSYLSYLKTRRNCFDNGISFLASGSLRNLILFPPKLPLIYNIAISMDNVMETLKEEKVLYLKSPLNGREAELVMTDKGITLKCEDSGILRRGFVLQLRPFFPSVNKYLKMVTVFSLPYAAIASAKQGKHGLQKNLLEISDKDGNTYKIVVNKLQEWLDALQPKMSKE